MQAPVQNPGPQSAKGQRQPMQEEEQRHARLAQ
jgi:hypothetical protein